MSNQWDFYFCRIDDRPASIALDLGIAAAVPDGDRPWLISVRLPMQRPRAEDGLSSSEESPILNALEDRLNVVLAEAAGAEPIGRLTWNGLRELFYQGRTDAGVDDALNAFAHAHPDREVLWQTQSDPDWSHYREFLYPSPGQMRWIEDRHVVDELRKRGDQLDVPRPVDHYVYFDNAGARDRFLAAASGQGFRGEQTKAKKGERRHGAHLVRADPVELHHIHEVALDLAELAETHGGEYDGWGCPVMRG